MGYFRAFTIVPKSSEREIRAKLRKYCSPIRIFESQDHVLLTYESRYFPRLSPQTTFTMAVDTRNLGYLKRGRTSLGKPFEATMNFTMGISVSLSRKPEIPNMGKELLEQLQNTCSSWEIDEQEDQVNLRFDLLFDEIAEPRKKIRRLAQILEKASIPYRSAIVTSAYSIVEGELPDSGLFCGPDVYVEVSQDGVSLLLNESESMLDGMDVDHWKRKRGHNGYYIEFPLQPRGLDPHKKRRKYVTLGTRGPNRDKPLHFIPIAEISESEILHRLNGKFLIDLSDTMRRDLENEIAYRKSLKDPT